MHSWWIAIWKLFPFSFFFYLTDKNETKFPFSFVPREKVHDSNSFITISYFVSIKKEKTFELINYLISPNGEKIFQQQENFKYIKAFWTFLSQNMAKQRSRIKEDIKNFLVYFHMKKLQINFRRVEKLFFLVLHENLIFV